MTQDFADHLAGVLQARKTMLRAEWDARNAAVLIPLYEIDGEWHALYTRRTEDVEAHRGQVSFPGGLLEAGDKDACDAALREAEEEIGLARSDVRILGQLDPLLTVTQFQIAPFVGIIPWPYELRLNKAEVARAFGVPLRWLNDPTNLETRKRKPFIPGPEIDVFYFHSYEDEIIWGATARLTLQLLELLGESETQL